MVVHIATFFYDLTNQGFRLPPITPVGQEACQGGPSPVRRRRGGRSGERVQGSNPLGRIALIEVGLPQIGIGVRPAAAPPRLLQMLDRLGIPALEKLSHAARPDLLHSVCRIHAERLPVLALRQLEEPKMIEGCLPEIVRHIEVGIESQGAPTLLQRSFPIEV